VAGFFGEGDDARKALTATATAPGAAPPAAPPPRRRRRDAGRSPERQRAERAIAVHRVVLGLAVVALLAVLLFVPTLPAPSARGGALPGVVVPAGITPATAIGAAGEAASGVECGPGVRQVPWSAYSVACQPAWHGANGGATAPGVSATTIRVSYRMAASAQLTELSSLLPPSAVGTSTEAVDTIEAYIATFNKLFELYGRRVVLVPYKAKSDFVSEDTGQGQQQAQQDALTASTGVKAFADVSLADSSSLYTADLAAQNVVSLSVGLDDAAFYRANSPFAYTPGASCTKAAVATAAVLGRQLAGLPAVDAGDPALQRSTRVFGVVYPQMPTATACAGALVADLAAAGVTPTNVVALPFDLSQLVNESQNAVAQMRAAGVTTLICAACDPVTPLFLMQAADNQGYHPEWWYQSNFVGGQTGTDSATRLFPPDQADHLLATGNQAPPYGLQEAVEAYRLGNPHARRVPMPTYAYAYAALLQLFDTLQLAGPDLTPANFLAAAGHLPASEPWGMFGAWDGRAGAYDPGAGYRVVRWDPTARSGVDQGRGAWVDCDAGRQFTYAAAGGDVPAHRQLVCSPAAGAVSRPPADRLVPVPPGG